MHRLTLQAVSTLVMNTVYIQPWHGFVALCVSGFVALCVSGFVALCVCICPSV